VDRKGKRNAISTIARDAIGKTSRGEDESQSSSFDDSARVQRALLPHLECIAYLKPA